MAAPRLISLSAAVHEIDPVSDPRWMRFLERHSGATVFHTPGWLEALTRTYGYRAAAITTSEPGSELTDGLVYCCVDSWFTGRRIVSVPFSDHCTPLVSNDQQCALLLNHLASECHQRNGEYVEIRPQFPVPGGLVEGYAPAARFYQHSLDLRLPLDALYRRLHPTCIRAKIARAQRQKLDYREGHSNALLDEFYRLAILTRRRHGIPPQPLVWYRNLIDCMGDRLQLRLLFRAGQAIAGILTLAFGRSMTYKYGCSNQKFHQLGAMQLLLWEAIQDAKHRGCEEFDMGRSDPNNQGLISFKDRWGTSRSPLVYFRNPPPSAEDHPESLFAHVAKGICAATPDRILVTAGNLLYKHIG